MTIYNRPDKVGEWGSNTGKSVLPSLAYRQEGFSDGEIPAAVYMNWPLNNAGDWQRYQNTLLYGVMRAGCYTGLEVTDDGSEFTVAAGVLVTSDGLRVYNSAPVTVAYGTSTSTARTDYITADFDEPSNALTFNLIESGTPIPSDEYVVAAVRVTSAGSYTVDYVFNVARIGAQQNGAVLSLSPVGSGDYPSRDHDVLSEALYALAYLGGGTVRLSGGYTLAEPLAATIIPSGVTLDLGGNALRVGDQAVGVGYGGAVTLGINHTTGVVTASAGVTDVRRIGVGGYLQVTGSGSGQDGRYTISEILTTSTFTCVNEDGQPLTWSATEAGISGVFYPKHAALINGAIYANASLATVNPVITAYSEHSLVRGVKFDSTSGVAPYDAAFVGSNTTNMRFVDNYVTSDFGIGFILTGGANEDALVDGCYIDGDVTIASTGAGKNIVGLNVISGTLTAPASTRCWTNRLAADDVYATDDIVSGYGDIEASGAGGGGDVKAAKNVLCNNYIYCGPNSGAGDVKMSQDSANDLGIIECPTGMSVRNRIMSMYKRSTSDQAISDATATVIQFNSQVTDGPDVARVSGAATSSWKFTADFDMRVQISGAVSLDMESSEYAKVYVYHYNAAAALQGAYALGSVYSTGGEDPIISLSGAVNMADTDYLQFIIYASTAATVGVKYQDADIATANGSWICIAEL